MSISVETLLRFLTGVLFFLEPKLLGLCTWTTNETDCSSQVFIAFQSSPPHQQKATMSDFYIPMSLTPFSILNSTVQMMGCFFFKKNVLLLLYKFCPCMYIKSPYVLLTFVLLENLAMHNLKQVGTALS